MCETGENRVEAGETIEEIFEEALGRARLVLLGSVDGSERRANCSSQEVNCLAKGVEGVGGGGKAVGQAVVRIGEGGEKGGRRRTRQPCFGWRDCQFLLKALKVVGSGMADNVLQRWKMRRRRFLRSLETNSRGSRPV